jgi:predicted metalloprotease
MRWRKVDNPDVIDQRGRSARLPGGRVALPGGLGAIGVIVYLLIQALAGGGSGGPAFDVDAPFGGGEAPAAQPGDAIPPEQDPQKDLKDFSAYVFTDAQRAWSTIFDRDGAAYGNAKLVLYSSAVDTGCGSASSAVGPFYCPADERVYLDLSFYRDMQDQLGAGGDFAWAYVIAHEVGHHVQVQTGTSDEVRRLSAEQPEEANALSVRQELQADCYSGVWANSVFRQGDLEDGDVEEAIRASGAVGDDRLQRRATGRVDPDSFTHGSSEQRKRWFDRGYRSGDPGSCDTFATDDL